MPWKSATVRDLKSLRPTRSTSKKRASPTKWYRKSRWQHLYLEPLEDRTLPAPVPLQSVLSNVQSALQLPNAIANDASMILSDAGVNIPIVNAALSSVTPLTNAVAEPLQTVLKVVSQLPTAWAALRSALQNASSAISGLTANPDSTGMNLNPLPDGNLFEGTWSQPLSGSVNLGNAALKVLRPQRALARLAQGNGRGQH